ncbi:MAG: AMP-binding protein, partial [Deltaproteobacteria bacterium]|nr:AMP-binding protein [Deltaproteobacteria bacterium]
HAAFVSHEGHVISYGELELQSNRFANGLRALGFEKGRHAATLSLNSLELLVAFFGILKAGGMIVPLNVRLAAPELGWILDHSDAAAFLFSEDFRQTAEELRPGLDHVRLFAMLGEGAPSWARSFDEEAFMVYTAGTTGRPKGVLLTHNACLWSAVNWAYSETYQPDDRSLQVFPLYHVAAIANILTYVYLGGTVFLKKTFDPADCMATIEREGITRWAAAPSVRLLGWGAAIMPVNTRRRLEEVFPGVGTFDNYGMTEAAGGITTLKPRDSRRKVACVGKPLATVEVRVVDERDRDLPPGQVGEVLFRGNNLMKGYYKDPETTAEALRGGWMHTGDLGRLDEEGFLYIVDRKKDMIITGAENVYPREVEEVLYAHPKIAEAAVIGVPDPTWGEAIKAVVVPRSGREASESEIIEFCRSRIAGYKCPKSVDFVKELPKNPAGKILKRMLRERYARKEE